MNSTEPTRQEESLSAPLYVGLLLAATLAPLGSTMIAVALPSIGADLSWPAAALTPWLVASYLITAMAFQSPAGKIGDIVGHVRNIRIGLFVYALGSATGLIWPSVPALVAARVLMALGGAIIVPSAMASVRNRIPPAQRGRAFGTFGATMSTAAAIGPLLGGELTRLFGWRSIFAANLPVAGLAMILVWSAARASDSRPKEDAPGIDWLGTALLLLVVISLVAGTRLETSLGPALIAVGIVAGLFLLYWEGRVTAPVFDPELFRRPVFTAAASITAFHNLAMYALLFQLPIFFREWRPEEAASLGRALMGMMVAMVIGAPIGARVGERIGARAIASLGTLTSIAGMWFLRDFDRLLSPIDALPGLLLLGLGLGLSSASVQASAMSVITSHEAGLAAGMSSTTRYLGGIVGISLMSRVLDAPTTDGAALHEQTVPIYLVALVCALVASQWLPRKVEKRS